jgi:hypothetical protein
MKRELLHLLLSCPLVTAFVGITPAQEGPLLPGLENSAAIEEPDATNLETNSSSARVIVPSGDDIRPLDAVGNPQSEPPFEGVLSLPEPPAIESEVDEQPKRNWLQKSTDAVRSLAKPDSKSPEPRADDKRNRDAIRNWQMLRRQPPVGGHPTNLAPPQGRPSQSIVPQQTQQTERAQTQYPVKSPRTNQPQSQMRAPTGVEAKSRAYQQPSSRRNVQAAPTKRAPQVKSQANSVDPRRTADSGPRSPWERPATSRLRPSAAAVKAEPSQGSVSRPTNLRSALGLDAPPTK